MARSKWLAFECGDYAHDIHLFFTIFLLSRLDPDNVELVRLQIKGGGCQFSAIRLLPKFGRDRQSKNLVFGNYQKCDGVDRQKSTGSQDGTLQTLFTILFTKASKSVKSPKFSW